MRSDLIDKIYNEFDKDREIIKQNLIMAMDSIYMTTKDEYNTIILEIRIERNNKNDSIVQ